MAAFVFVILQIFFETCAVFKIWEYINNNRHLARKHVRIFVRRHYLFREANSFSRAKLEENCQLRGIDNVQGIFSPEMEAIVFIILQIFFATRVVLKIVEYLINNYSMSARGINLVPRSLVDEAEGEIWQSKENCFFLIGCSICLLSNPLFDTVFRGKLSSNSSSSLEISAVGENEKPIRKDGRRKDLEVICHSGLNNFCNMIVPLLKSQTRHPARAQAPLHLPHMLFRHKTLQTLSCSHFVFMRLRGRLISAPKHVGS